MAVIMDITLTVEASGIRNSVGLWNDGLDDSTCINNGQVYIFEFSLTFI